MIGFGYMQSLQIELSKLVDLYSKHVLYSMIGAPSIHSLTHSLARSLYLNLAGLVSTRDNSHRRQALKKSLHPKNISLAQVEIRGRR